MKWFAVYTRCHHERKVVRQLKLKGITSFFPELQVFSNRWDRNKIIKKPLFPGYLFINIRPLAQNFLNVIKTPSVCYILDQGGKPASIPDDEIDSLKIFISQDRKITRYPFMKRGDRIRVKSGPLKGAVGILVGSNPDKRRMVISVELMRRSVSTLLFDDEIEPY